MMFIVVACDSLLAVFVLGRLRLLLFGVEKLLVCLQLEDEVQDVKDEEDDGSAFGEDKNIIPGARI